MENFQRIKVVGKGSYGEVWLSKHCKDKKQYVLKKMDVQKASKRERQAAEQEAKLLSKLKHPNIVAYKDSFETDGYLWIAMGFCEGGDLYNHLKTRRGELLEERQIVEWFVQISMALQYLHERNILHRDLKTQNIFLTRSKIIKLGDLGIARVLDSSSDMATTMIGTPYYMSPELFSNKPYNHKSDVWALGCCVYEMTTLKHAFNAKDMNALVYKILRGKMPPMPLQYSNELNNLIRAMLDQNPGRRPSVNKILRDPFIKRNIAVFLEGTRKNRKPNAASKSAVDGRTHLKPDSRPDSGGRRKDRPSSGDQRQRRNDPFGNPIPVDKPRPLPQISNPVSQNNNLAPKKSISAPTTPAVENSSPYPSIIGSSSELDEGQCTNPNMSARARRRERSMRNDTPRSSYDGIQNIHLEPRRRGSANSERGGSARSDRSERSQASDRHDSPKHAASQHSKKVLDSSGNERRVQRRQASVADDDDEEEESSSADTDEDRDRKREEKEVEHLEKALDATLHIQADLDEDTLELEEAATPQPAIPQVKSQPVLGQPPMFSKETLNSSGRLMARIVALRKDCLHTVGLPKLHKAYQILDNIESDSMEAQLLDLLGQELFDGYAGKIWQLKFCEESAFRIN